MGDIVDRSEKALDEHLLEALSAVPRLNQGNPTGVCKHCEEEIDPRRLESIPTAVYCAACQTLAERGEL